jgi:hypothetical protein
MMAWHEPGLLYLDPATGSIALQVAIGGLLAAMAAVRIYWGKLRSVFGRRDKAPSGDSLTRVSERGHSAAH